MVTPDFKWIPAQRNHGIDVGKKRIKEAVAKLLTMLGVERSATIKGFEMRTATTGSSMRYFRSRRCAVAHSMGFSAPES